LVQASNQMKSTIFQKLVKKIVDREEAFGEKPTPSTSETIYLAHKEKSKQHDSSIGESNRRGCGRRRKSFRGRGECWTCNPSWMHYFNIL